MAGELVSGVLSMVNVIAVVVTDLRLCQQYVDILARQREVGEKNKAVLEAGVGDVLTLGHARRELAFARRMYKEILIEQRNFLTKYKLIS